MSCKTCFWYKQWPGKKKGDCLCEKGRTYLGLPVSRIVSEKYKCKKYVEARNDLIEFIDEVFENQTPKKPDPEKHDFMGWRCPNCNMTMGKIMGNYCHHCGTKLDWSDEV